MGSGITPFRTDLNTFVDRANLAKDGDMRVSRDGGDLINKSEGSLGRKLANFFTDVGRLLGVVKDTKGNEVADRQKAALEGFREALSQRFTSSVADQVLSKYDGKLTGRFVLDTVRSAEEQSGKVRDHNAGIDSKEQLNSVMNKHGVRQDSLTDGQRATFYSHFSDLKYNAVKDDLHKLEGQELAGIAVDSLRLALGSERALGSDNVKGHVDEMKGDLKRNYEFNGGREFDKVWKKVDEQLQKASTAILKGPKEGLSAGDRRDLVNDMKHVLDSMNVDQRAKDNALMHFNNTLGGLRMYREEPPRA